MKKIVSAVLSLSLFVTLSASIVSANPSESQTQPVQAQVTQAQVSAQTDSKKIYVNGVEVEIIGLKGSLALDESSEYYKESIRNISGLISGTNNDQSTVLWDPDQGSSERYTPVYNKDYERKVYDDITRAAKYAVGVVAGWAAAVYSSDVATSLAIGGFITGVADMIFETTAPSYTETFIIKAWSAYYNRSIYKVVTYEYDDKYRQHLTKVKLTGPLDLVNKNQFRAI